MFLIVYVFQFSGHIKRILNCCWRGRECEKERTAFQHKLLIQLMPWYFPHYSMRVTKLKPTDEYGKNMCYNNNNFPASFLFSSHFGRTTVFFERSLMCCSCGHRLRFTFGSFHTSHHFLTLLNMFAHVMVCWSLYVCLVQSIPHDVKLWRTKTTTSPMGKSQYFISFWQLEWFFHLFWYDANTRG